MGVITTDYLGGDELIAGKINTEQIPVVADTYYRGMGLKYSVAGTSTPGTNTGNGTVTGITATNKAPIGNYALVVTDPNAGGTATATAAAGTNTGNGAISAITTGTDTLEGVYVVKCVTAVSNGGIFSVVDPNGDRLADLTVGVAYSNAHLGLTVSDGATDFIVGDLFNITAVRAHGSKLKLTDPNGIVLKNDIQLPGTPGGTVTVYVNGLTFIVTDGSTDFALNDSFTLAIGGAGSYEYTTNIQDISAIYNGLDGQVYSAPGYTYAIMSGELYEAGLKTDANAAIILTVGQRQQYADRGFYVRPR